MVRDGIKGSKKEDTLFLVYQAKVLKLGMVLSRAWQVQVGALDRTFWPLWGKSGAH